MMISHSLFIIRSVPVLLSLLSILLAGCPSPTTPQPNPQPSETTPPPPAVDSSKKESDINTSLKIVDSTPTQLIVRTEDGKGIGRTMLERPKDGWPKTVVLQLPLRGLESLKIASDSNVAEIIVSSHGDLSTTVKLNDSQYKTSDLDNQLVKVMPDATAPKTIPLPEGSFFQVSIPAELIASNPDRLEIHWIDFYR